MDVSARLLWDERSARLKLIMPGGERGDCLTCPARTVRRGPAGEVPGGRWVRVFARDGAGRRSASPATRCTASTAGTGQFRATVARASRYANDVKTAARRAEPWLPAVDSGELKFRFLLSPGGDAPAAAGGGAGAAAVQSLLVPAKEGRLPRSGSLAALAPAALKLLALKPDEDGKAFILRVQNTADETVEPDLTWMGHRLKLSAVSARRIVCWRLSRYHGRWKATATDILEG